jgi:hypothetical protein
MKCGQMSDVVCRTCLHGGSSLCRKTWSNLETSKQAVIWCMNDDDTISDTLMQDVITRVYNLIVDYFLCNSVMY